MANKFPWLRLWNETVRDRKIDRISRQLAIPKAVVLGVWTMFLCYASESPQRGRLMISEEIWIEEEELVAESGLDPITFGKIITAFQDLNMVAIADGFELPNWNKRQFESDHSTPRVRKHRAKKKTKAKETFQERSSNVIERETETETKTERERENGMQKRTHIYRSCHPNTLPLKLNSSLQKRLRKH